MKCKGHWEIIIVRYLPDSTIRIINGKILQHSFVIIFIILLL